MDSSRQLLWILPDSSYGFFQIPWISMTQDLTGKDVFWKVIEWQEHWLKDQCRYPILLHWRMWSSGTPGHGVTFCYPVPLGPLLRGPCHFGPSCAKKTTALKLVLLLWIVDSVSESITFVMEYAFDEAIRNPMDNWLTNQSPPPHPKYHHWQYLWSTYGLMSSKMKITVIKKMVIV